MSAPLYQNRDLATTAAERLKVYAQPQRLMILSCLLRGERNVAEIGDATQIVQPALSQQLGELRRANLVQTRKEAKQVWYQLADEDVTTCVRTMEAIFGGSGKLEDVLVARAPESVNMLAAGIAGFAKVLNRTAR